MKLAIYVGTEKQPKQEGLISYLQLTDLPRRYDWKPFGTMDDEGDIEALMNSIHPWPVKESPVFRTFLKGKMALCIIQVPENSVMPEDLSGLLESLNK